MKLTRYDKIILIVLFVGWLIISLRRALEFPITSDSLIEYRTYLQFLSLGSKWWRPITDNMLSTCLWTTYFPSLIQRILQLDNPIWVYRICVGAIVSLPPALMYLLSRRFTTTLVSLIISLVLATSFYYDESVYLARMFAALSSIIVLVYMLDAKKWLYAFVAGISLLVAYYTVSFFFIGVFCLGTLLALALYKFNKNKVVVRLVVTSFTLVVFMLVYYFGIGVYARAGQYAYAGARQVVLETTGISLPILYASTPPDVMRSFFDVPKPNVHEEDVPAQFQQPLPTLSLSWNPFQGERLDFVVAKIMVLIRAIIIGVVLVLLYRKDKWNNILPYLCIFSVVFALVGIWLPAIARILGSVRLAFFSLPVELATVSLWCDMGNRKALTFFLFLGFIMLYH